ncbi:MAG: AAA family ATPase [Rhodospirillaceae bacterium]|nr:AAA family ATPase [Rhodospirillaceae bacterium]
MTTPFDPEDPGHAPGPQDRPEPLLATDPTLLQGRPVPERRWIVGDWLPMGQTTSLYGAGGTGKTLLAQQLATCVATGRQWLHLPTHRCRALAVFCEDDEDELHRRQHDINSHYGCQFSDLADFRWISRVGDDNLLMTFDAGRTDGVGRLKPFWTQICEAAKDFGARLVILDTAADMFGGSEIARPQVRQFVQGACTRIAREIDGAVLLCAHPSLSGQATGRGDGGSTAWSASVRSRLYLSLPPKPDTDDVEVDDDLDDQRFLSRKKANYARSGEQVVLRWDKGVFVREDVAATDLVDTIERRNRELKGEETFGRCLDALDKQGINVSHAKGTANYAPKYMAQHLPDAKGYSERRLVAAMHRLLNAGKIAAGVTEIRGADRKRKPGLIRIHEAPDG